MIYIYILQGIVLALASVEDFRKKEIHLYYILAMSAVAIIGTILNHERSLFSMLGGLSIGLCMIGLSIISKEQIGRGDGLVMSALGLMLGARTGITLLCMASLIQALISIGILVLKKGNKTTKIPFVPSLFLGYVGSLVFVL